MTNPCAVSCKPTSRIKRLLNWLPGAIGGIILATYFSGLLPSSDRLLCETRLSLAQLSPLTRLTVLLAPIEGDSESTGFGAFIDESIRKNFGIHVTHLCKPMPKSNGDIAIISEKERERALKWLERYNGDLLIWGRILNRQATAYFVSRYVRVEDDNTAFIGNDELSIPLPEDAALDELSEHLEGYVIATLLVHLLRGVAGSDDDLVRIADSLATLHRSGRLDGFSAEAHQTILFFHGVSLVRVARRSAEQKQKLMEAVRAFEDALTMSSEYNGRCTESDESRSDQHLFHSAIILSELGDARMALYGLDPSQRELHLNASVNAYGCAKRSLEGISDSELGSFGASLVPKLESKLMSALQCEGAAMLCDAPPSYTSR